MSMRTPLCLRRRKKRSVMRSCRTPCCCCRRWARTPTWGWSFANREWEPLAGCWGHPVRGLPLRGGKRGWLQKSWPDFTQGQRRGCKGAMQQFASCYVLLCLSQIVPFPLLHELKLWRLLAVGSGCQNGVHVLNNLWSMTNRNWSRAETALLLCQPRAAPFFLMQQDRGCQDCGLHAGSPMPHSFIQHILLPHAEPSLLSLKTHSF